MVWLYSQKGTPMNFRSLLLATMVAFSSMPAMALLPRVSIAPSFVGRFYTYASTWVSSSFLVSREFVTREFSELRNRFAIFKSEIAAADMKIAGVEKTLTVTLTDQTHDAKTFAENSKAQILTLENQKKALEDGKTKAEALANKIEKQKERAEKTEADVNSAYAVATHARESVANTRNAVTNRLEEAEGELKSLKDSINTHYENRNKTLGSLMALSEAHRKNLLNFSAEINHALAEAKKRNEEQKKTSDGLIKLQKHAEEQEIKVNALSIAWAGFKEIKHSSSRFQPCFTGASLVEVSFSGTQGINSRRLPAVSFERALTSSSKSSSKMEEVD